MCYKNFEQTGLEGHCDVLPVVGQASTVTSGGDVTPVAHTRKVVVCVPMMVDGNISGEGGIARCTLVLPPL